MSNMHRIVWFDLEVRAMKYPNSSTLSEKFEISIRQAQRDIDYLKNSMGAPLLYVAEKRGYEYEDTAYTLPYMFITEEQKKILNYLAHSYENYSNDPRINQIAELFKKLMDEESSGDDVPVFDVEKPEINDLYIINNAIKNRKKLRVLYRHPDMGKIDLTIHPYKLFNKYNTNYFASYCEDFKEETALRLDRIIEIKMLNENFNIMPGYDEKKYTGSYKKEPFVARIGFKLKPDDNIILGINLKSVDEFVYDVEFYNIDEFVGQLMTIDYIDAIYHPNWLKDRLKEKCNEMLNCLNK